MLIALLLTFCIAVTNLAWIFFLKKVRGKKSLVVFFITLVIWSVVYALFYYVNSVLWLPFTFLLSTIASTSLLTYALEYTGRTEHLTRVSLLILAMEPLLTQILFWTNDLHHLFFANSGLTGAWYWVNVYYSDGLVLVAVYFLAQAFQYKSRQYSSQTLTIIAGLLIPILAKIIDLGKAWLIPDLELSPFVFTN